MELNKERFERERKEFVAADAAGRRRIKKRQWIRKRRAAEQKCYLPGINVSPEQFSRFEELRRSLPGKPTRKVLLASLFDFALSHPSVSVSG